MTLLRAVVVTNHDEDSLGSVVLAVEAKPWHTHPKDAEECNDDVCKKCHRIHVLNNMVFDFETRRVYPLGNSAGWGVEQIPSSELKRFNTDFGVYYSS